MVNVSVLKGWIYKPYFIIKWLPIVEYLKGDSVRYFIPSQYIETYHSSPETYSSSYLKLYYYREWICNNQTKITVIKSGLKNRFDIVNSKEKINYN